MTTRRELVRLSHRSWGHLGREEFTTDPTKKEQSVAQALSLGLRNLAGRITVP